MKHLLLLSLVFLNACAGISSESDSSPDAVSAEFCASETSRLFPVLADTVMQDDFSPEPVISPSVDACEGGVSIPPKKKGMCERLYEKQKARTPVKIEQRADMYPQDEEVPVLDYHLLPEPEVVKSIKAFLSKNKYPTLDVDDMGNYRLRMWLKTVVSAVKLWQKEIFIYPFFEDIVGTKVVFRVDRYASEIKEVMQRLLGIFCWELKQSRGARDALPGWKPKEGKEERYPKIKKIFTHWKQGPFPQSFCANIMFLMQNKKRLEKLGCEMDFLDECCNYLPASLHPFMSGSFQYKEFYKDVFCHTDIYKKAIFTFLHDDVVKNDKSREGEIYQDYHKFYLSSVECMEEWSREKKSAEAMWLCDLANKLMIANIILGKRFYISISIQGLAAYINSHLEYVQVFPNCDGMNTETLNDLVHVITGGKSDIGVYDRAKRACYVDSWNQMVFPLHKKSHGLKWGIPQFVKEKGWVKRPEYYTQEDEAFHKTKAAMACLTRFGISSDVVTTLQLCMDAKGEIPSSLYHNPLTDSALNNLLASCEKERVVKSHALNAMKRSVDRIVYQSKVVWQKGAVDYKRYQEFFACDRVITKADLVALEEVITQKCVSRFWKFAVLSPFFFISGGVVLPYNYLLLAIREHIVKVIFTMRDQHRDIVKGNKRLKDLRYKMELMCFGKPVWRQELQDLADIKETTVYEAHLAKDEEKAKMLKSFCQSVCYSKATLEQDILPLIKNIAKLCTDFRRKREILQAFSKRITPESEGCLARQPVNIIVLFLKSLGVENPPLAQTPQEVSGIFADIIDRRPFRCECPVPDRYLQKELEDLFALQV